MKAIINIAFAITLLPLFSALRTGGAPIEQLNGAWQLSTDSGQIVMIIEDHYCAITSYNPDLKEFHFTKGGVLTGIGDSYRLKMEFHSANPSEVGTTSEGKFSVNGNHLQMEMNGNSQKWARIDNKSTPLTGCWRINGRLNDGKMRDMHLNPRKTLKILSGTRFQWMAINTKSKEFFGSGGGTYTFKNGKYTEHIEFFSRDSSRVGASLTFDGKVEGAAWFHSGTSSTGNPVNERWIRHWEEIRPRQ